MAPQIIGGQELKKTKPSNITKAGSRTPPRNSLYVILLLLKYKDDL
jgi:hypothetical protein